MTTKTVRKNLQPSTTLRLTVKRLVSGGYDLQSIASYVGMTETEVKIYFAKEIRLAKADLDSLVMEKFMEKIQRGDKQCLLYYLKHRMNWEDHPDKQSVAVEEESARTQGFAPIVVSPMEATTAAMESSTKKRSVQ